MRTPRASATRKRAGKVLFTQDLGLSLDLPCEFSAAQGIFAEVVEPSEFADRCVKMPDCLV
ncbi:MAG: hypothetical protein AB1758_01965 [Candidatus Eremiobacterota bacterium]